MAESAAARACAAGAQQLPAAGCGDGCCARPARPHNVRVAIKKWRKLRRYVCDLWAFRNRVGGVAFRSTAADG
jgi:hypothetical protein